MTGKIDALLARKPELAPCRADLQRTFALLAEAFRAGKKLLVCGNGGSAADSEHIVGELMKGYLLPRPLPAGLKEKLAEAYAQDGEYLAAHLQGALPAISLVSQTSLTSAFSNDVAADLTFAQQVLGYGQPGDALLALSTSGVSRNVIYALQTARARGLVTLGLTGASGGAMAGLCDALVRVPSTSTPEIQERHLAIYHALCEELEEAFFG